MIILSGFAIYILKAQSLPEDSTLFVAEHWYEWSDDEKVCYVLGFGAALYSVVLEVSEKHPELFEEMLALHNRIEGLSGGQIMDIIDNVYWKEEYYYVPLPAMIVNIKMIGE